MDFCAAFQLYKMYCFSFQKTWSKVPSLLLQKLRIEKGCDIADVFIDQNLGITTFFEFVYLTGQ